MKKIFIAAALLMCFGMASKAEVVSRDTVSYNGGYKLEKIEKANEYGEVSVRYVALLLDITNSKGEPRKVTVTKATYESGKITHLVYNNQDNGSRKISKAVNKDDK